MKKSEATPVRPVRQFWFACLLTALLAVAWGTRFLSPTNSRMMFIALVMLALFPVMCTALRKMMAGRIFTIETLMSIASVGALMIDATAEAAVVLWLFHVGESLEAYAARRARSGISALMALVQEKAMLILKDRYREVRVSQLRPGDVIEVSPGGRLPVDVALLDAAAAFDESALTGESLPVERLRGEIIPAGNLVVDRICRLRVVSEPGASAVARILKLIDEADAHKSPTERFLDTFSRYYTPLIALRPHTVIRQNVTFSIGLKLVFLLTSVLGLTGQWVAILADSGATVLVAFNALRLMKLPQTELGMNMGEQKEEI